VIESTEFQPFITDQCYSKSWYFSLAGEELDPAKITITASSSQMQIALRDLPSHGFLRVGFQFQNFEKGKTITVPSFYITSSLCLPLPPTTFSKKQNGFWYLGVLAGT
jgi:hypothetical protein